MALQLSVELESGLTLEYWKILSITLVGETNCTVAVGVYKDAAARTAGKIPAKVNHYSFQDSDNPCIVAALEADSPYVLVYDKLKTLDEFIGATDV